MKNMKIMLLSVAAVMSLVSCGSNQSKSQGPAKDPKEVSVFVLSGQSNMEGNTSFEETKRENNVEVKHDLVAEAFEEMNLDDPELLTTDGMPEVMVSTYCCGYGQLDHNNLHNNRSVNATNTEDQIAGKFVPAKTGLGSGTSKMGPELGAAYILKDHADADKPIYFIKMASNGSGFAQDGTQYNWPVKDADGNFPEVNMYSCFAKPFIENNLKLIEDEGWHPVIKAWLWHQGESDCADNKIPVYGQRLGDMLELFRNDFAEYAKDGEGENIAFIDGMVYQGSGTSWHDPDKMNAEKEKFAATQENRYLVDIYANEDKIPENELKPGNPGGDSMHYNAKSCLRLGMAYGRIIVENDLLD